MLQRIENKTLNSSSVSLENTKHRAAIPAGSVLAASFILFELKHP